MIQGLRRALATVARSVYWSEDDGRLVVTAWGASGESAKQFGDKHGLSARRLLWWSRRLGEPTVTPPPVRANTVRANTVRANTVRANTVRANTVELVPIGLIQRDDRDEPIEIAVGAFTIRVPRRVDPDALRVVVGVLRSC
jgi:hypothetical protein